jgi:hypothetical protein
MEPAVSTAVGADETDVLAVDCVAGIELAETDVSAARAVVPVDTDPLPVIVLVLLMLTP